MYYESEGVMSQQLRKSPEARRAKSSMARKLWALGGFTSFGLGVLGVALPVLPTTPFVLLAAFCFARSSEKVEQWFKSTKLYRRVFETYMTSKEMTLQAKLAILIPITLLLGISAYFMRRITWMLLIFAIVWIGHIVYFGFVVKLKRTA